MTSCYGVLQKHTVWGRGSRELVIAVSVICLTLGASAGFLVAALLANASDKRTSDSKGNVAQVAAHSLLLPVAPAI